MESFRLAELNDLSSLISLYSKCKQTLLYNMILPLGDWYDNYPNEIYLENAIVQHELFVLVFEIQIIGSVILNENQSSEWKSLNWLGFSKQPLVIHALVIDPDHQSKGFGKKLLNHCEGFAKNRNYSSIRLDSFSKNPVSNKLYQNYGYIQIGTVTFDKKPVGNQEYICYQIKFILFTKPYSMVT